MNDNAAIRVRLIAKTDVPPLALASHAAKTCYAASTPDLQAMLDGSAKLIEVEKKLFRTGHHTTMEHTYFTFEIDGIAVGDIDFGFHLTTPYYNTDQRSGRYAKMFDNPDLSEIAEYIKAYYPEVKDETIKQVLAYLEFGLSVYKDQIKPATSVCLELLETERPRLTQALRDNAGKIAQEQLRSFIPIIVPTGFDYTIDLITLAGLYQTASTPVMRAVTHQMVTAVLEAHPELDFVFAEKSNPWPDFAPALSADKPSLTFEPSFALLSIDDPVGFEVPARRDKFPIDRTTTLPYFMNNEVGSVAARVSVTAMTYGQDQRHRGNRRSIPEFTGEFLLSPILAKLGLESEAIKLMELWFNLRGAVPECLHATLAPYGAMLTYVKRGSLNALAHEQSKRLCFCAQQEIYQLNRQLRLQLEANEQYNKYLSLVEPPCMSGGCAEPDRYCGRDINDKENYFPSRSV